MEYVNKVGLERTICASHRLTNVDTDHQCSSMHGHNYKVEVEIIGELGDDGFLIEFDEIKAVIDQYDHGNLNDLLECTTAECLSEDIASEILLIPDYCRLEKVVVRVYETPKNWAETVIVNDSV